MLSRSTFHRLAVSTVATAALAAAAGAQDQSVLVRAGGSTFAAPLYKAWIEAYGSAAPTVDISYDVIGSGEGIDRFLTGSLDFAATDAPLTTKQEAEVAGGVTHVPVTAGMVAVAYNLPGDLEGELRLPRDVLGDIFAGRNHHLGRSPYRRGQPRTGASTPDALRRRAPGWQWHDLCLHQSLGRHQRRMAPRRQRRRYPRRLAKPGNAGARQRGGRGEGPARGRDHRLRGVRDRQAGGPAARRASECFGRIRHAHPPKSGAAAIAAATIPEDMKINMPDPGGDGAYPIVTFTWELLRNAPEDETKAQAVEAFTKWAITEGQNLAPGLGYVPMPQAVRDRAGRAMSAAF